MPAAVAEAAVTALEDAADLRAARAVIAEGGKPIPAEKVFTPGTPTSSPCIGTTKREGPHRVLYAVHDEVLVVTVMGGRVHRREVYRRL